jgi:hypothetical protein
MEMSIVSDYDQLIIKDDFSSTTSYLADNMADGVAERRAALLDSHR